MSISTSTTTQPVSWPMASLKPLVEQVTHRMYNPKLRPTIHIIKDDPGDLLPPLQRQWQSLMRRTQEARDQAATPAQAQEFSEQLAYMQSAGLAFYDDDVAQMPSPSSVLHSTRYPPVRVPTLCYTLHIGSPTVQEICHILAVWTPPCAIVIAHQPRSGRFLEITLPAMH